MNPFEPARVASALPDAVPQTTYRCVVEYDGTAYHGWQFQPALRTVCGDVETVLSSLFAERISVTAAGRTDSGVHATGQVISFSARRVFPIERLALALNARLPGEVSVRDACIVEPGFSARFDARHRIYEYLIVNRPAPSAAIARFAHHVWKPIDRDRFERAAADLIGEFDFVAFCGVLPASGPTIRSILSVVLERSGDLVRIRIVGDGFLHRMVRITVGTLVEIATNRRPADDIPRVIASRDRRLAGYTAPACGLFLAGVTYDGYTSYRPALPGFEPQMPVAPPHDGRASVHGSS